jgi:hypothetical protein
MKSTAASVHCQGQEVLVNTCGQGFDSRTTVLNLEPCSPVHASTWCSKGAKLRAAALP